MPTTKSYNINCSAGGTWIQTGSGPFIFSWDGGSYAWGSGTFWDSNAIGGTINLTSGLAIYDFTDPFTFGTPPFVVTQASIQALINGGATFIGDPTRNLGIIGGGSVSITGTSVPLPQNLTSIMTAAWTLTTTSHAGGLPELIFAYISFQLSIPDPPPPYEYIGTGGIEVGDLAGSGEFIKMSQLIIIGSGGLKIGGETPLVLSVDPSGIYTLVKNKTNDTLYNRTAGGVETSLVVKIPDPFIKTGFIGG